MLSQISWTLLLLAIAVVAILYYTLIAVLYYPVETLTFLLGRKNKLPPGTALMKAGERQLSLLGPAMPEVTTEDYLKRYQPAAVSDPPAEIVRQPGVQGPKGRLQDTAEDDDDEGVFIVASDHEGHFGIEIAKAEMQTSETALHTNVSDLMESIKILLRVIKDGEGDTTDVTSFFPSLLAQYPLISDSKYRYSINQFIYDNCRETLSDSLSIEAINELWCFPYPPQAA